MKIYKLIYEGGYFYYGITKSSLKQRFNEHKRHSKLYPNLKRYSKPVLSIEVVEECDNKDREDYYIRMNIDNPLCLNENNAVRTQEDKNKYMREVWYTNEDNRQKTLDRCKEYYQQQKEIINEKHICELCGGKYTTRNKNKHLKTEKHKSLVIANE